MAAMPERSDGASRLATIPGMVPGLYDRPTWLPVCAALRLCRRTTAAPSARRCATWQGGMGALPFPWLRGMPPRMSQPTRAVLNTATSPTRGGGARPAPGLQNQPWLSARRPTSCRRSAASRSRVQPGKTLAVVGESGCGKSTLARMVSLIETPTAGELRSTASMW